MMIFGVLTIVVRAVTATIPRVGSTGAYGGGQSDRSYGKWMMRARVIGRGVTVLILAPFLLPRSLAAWSS